MEEKKTSPSTEDEATPQTKPENQESSAPETEDAVKEEISQPAEKTEEELPEIPQEAKPEEIPGEELPSDDSPMSEEEKVREEKDQVKKECEEQASDAMPGDRPEDEPRKSRKSLWFVLGALVLVIIAGICIFASQKSESASAYQQVDIDIDQLSAMMDEGQTFTLLVERDNCPFCEQLNAYIDSTKDEHDGVVVYHLDVSDYEMYREQEGDMTLISETEAGQEFLSRFPYFLYTPAIYKVDNGQPVSEALGYDAARYTVSLWNVDSPIDWDSAKPVDVWEYLAELPADAENAS